MMKTVRFIAISVFIILVSNLSFAEDKITISGTGDSQNLLRVLAQHFESAHQGTRIDVPDSTGSGGGVKATAMGKCNLGRVARPIKENENTLTLMSRILTIKNFFEY